MRKRRMSSLKKFRIAAIAIIMIITAASIYGEKETSMPAVSANSLTAVHDPESSAATETPAAPLASQVELAALPEEKTEAAATLLSAVSTVKSDKAVSGKKEEEKIVYLTFDDGPSKLTDEVLSILKEEEVTATFFVLGEHAKQSPEIILRTAEAGHAIGNHTYDHEYSDLYSSFPRFWNQIKQTEEVLREITGDRPVLLRAPGGTYGHFDETYFKLLEQAGYKVFDWDVDSGDSRRKGVPAAEIVKNATSEKLKNEMIVLLHDGTGHGESVKALPEIIKFYKNHGYGFRALTPEQNPVQFSLAASVKSKTKPAPSAAWIENHVLPNAALFGPGQPLYVEAGGVETKLEPGEYELSDGQYMVPLRSMMERLGAKVMWDGPTQSALLLWGDATVTIDPRKETLVSQSVNQPIETLPVTFSRKYDSLWISLRPLLESTGHSIVSFKSGRQERRVKAL
ncbi:peptidoglycan/xylan/chitin deacetylase (PgdA/CDA1 family) [Fontibacillus phaseoli]|uniref:Peptidoglycan/xylan/chitin deacetylase (PgdA/CDA1 family) n=1 Tax=Fontibacillus phaseoli TaxID=1416533 RepID=A0A369B4N0_9BACL|nr:polysaccharide deacetylase [Fontibacillus phaseoli]RCX16245.1 peptidoglycan/xylan/chitin deacetylase (PgdA/CDA1 family) [Fontibacillus phaseoli]